MEDLSGRQFGPYRIVEPLGEGGMAAVYKAYQPTVDRYVALKVLPRPLMSDRQFAGRFKQEAQLLAALQHPHILAVFDFGQSDGYAYIVMPFVESGTLAQRLQGNPLPHADVVRIMAQLGDALDYAHSQGVVHRDIKPSNVLLDRRNNCLLSDFGIAKLYEGTTHYTATGGIIGTPAYMSPEQGEGKPVDHRSDIYSLGVVLYEMVTGRVPFYAETPIATVLKHITDPLPMPRTFNPLVPESVERVILRALAKHPDERFATAGDMVRAVQATASPHRPAAITVNEQPAKPGASRWLLLTAGALLIVGLILGSVWALARLNNDNAPRSALDTTLEGGAGELAMAGDNPTDTPGAAELITSNQTAEVATDARASAAPTTTTAHTATTALSTATSEPTPTVTPEPATNRVDTNEADDAEIVFIPGGPVTLGLTESQIQTLLGLCPQCSDDHFDSSRPVHRVQLDAFWIYRTEVTNGMYALCVQTGACAAPSRSSSNTRLDYWGTEQFRNFPVIHVNWFAATNYCSWAGGRLPTNAEWEKAARGESTTLFPWGDTPPSLQLANVGQEDGDTRAVGSYPQGASPYGVLDMAGNVWEWASDWFAYGYYRDSPLENPQGPTVSDNGARVGRGGSWFWNGSFASAGYRDWWEPENDGSGVGFRCVIDVNADEE